MKKRVIIGILSISFILILSIGGTLAFLTDSEEIVNRFDMGDLDIEIEEPNWHEDDGENLVPGTTRLKDPTITNVQSDSYMRAIMRIVDDAETIPNPEYKDEKQTPGVSKTIPNPNYGKVITDAARAEKILKLVRFDSTYNAENEPVTKNIVPGKMYSLSELESYPTVNETNFTFDSSKSTTGTYYYNYKGIFPKNGTAVLFTNAVIPKDFSRSDLKILGKFQIKVSAQAIQAENFSSAEEAFAALDEEEKAGTLEKNYKS